MTLVYCVYVNTCHMSLVYSVYVNTCHMSLVYSVYVNTCHMSLVYSVYGTCVTVSLEAIHSSTRNSPSLSRSGPTQVSLPLMADMDDGLPRYHLVRVTVYCHLM
jgi:hypothetical protein